MKEFRFAWNGKVISREDTRWILGTIAVTLLFLLAGLYLVIFES